MKTIILAALAALAMSSAASAHDFWIQPDRFAAEPGETLGVGVYAGHAGDRAPWAGGSLRVTSLRSVGPGGVRDYQGSLLRGQNATTGAVVLKEPGLHVIALETSNALSVLPPEAFNAYAAEEGILPIISDRVKTGRANTPGRELYSRRAKTIVRVGDVASDPSIVTRPLGMTLEITPLADPYALSPGEPLVLEVRYRGAPLTGASIHVGRLDTAADLASLKTDPQGRASFPTPAEGDWYFQVVWAQPADALLEGADYLTVFSSLSLGYEPLMASDT